jgi:hypothetical protein
MSSFERAKQQQMYMKSLRAQSMIKKIRDKRLLVIKKREQIFLKQQQNLLKKYYKQKNKIHLKQNTQENKILNAAERRKKENIQLPKINLFSEMEYGKKKENIKMEIK